MDALIYELITGLTNYEGFKSVLKNSVVGQRGNVEDENILLNSVRVLNGSGSYALNANQVAVILNAPYPALYLNNTPLLITPSLFSPKFTFIIDLIGNK